MDLYIFPTRASTTNGYSIAVLSDFKRMQPAVDDLVIWYVIKDAASSVLKPADRIIKRPKALSLIRAMNVLKNRVSCELSSHSLNLIPVDQVERIFCGDIIMYRTLRNLFPDKLIIVRFHNCFMRIGNRLKILDLNINLRFKINLNALSKLEKEIFKDTNAFKIFISEEDGDYYKLMMGKVSDFKVWSFEPDMEKVKLNRLGTHMSNKIVWFGGMDSHKTDSVKWFIDFVFNKLQKSLPDIEFHLWGVGSEMFNNPSKHIYGHGFYDKDGLPLCGESLYINPDIIGGGVKIKLLSYFEAGAPFITTPYGFEGYSKDLIDGKYCQVVEMDKWFETIRLLLKPV